MNYPRVVIYFNKNIDILSSIKMEFANPYDIEANRPENCAYFKVLKMVDLTEIKIG
jgi:hypothetical protein